MSTKKAKRIRLYITLTIGILFTLATILVIKFAKGYRPNLSNRSLNGTGLLSVTSYPKSAQVFINNKLTTLTDDTLYLTPKTYQVKIKKTGFGTWQKDIPISTELVSLADVRLFPSPPSITPLTFSGATKAIPNLNGDQIAYAVKNTNNKINSGVYILSLNNNLLSSDQIIQITNIDKYDYTKAQLFWSPNGKQILAVFISKNNQILASHLLETKSFNSSKDITDITVSLPLIIKEWQTQILKREQSAFRAMPQPISDILIDKAINIYFSPSKEKIFYTATSDANLPKNKPKDKLPSVNSTPETRLLKANHTYVYDIKEDTNYIIKEAKNNTQLTKKIIRSKQQTKTNSTESANTKQIVTLSFPNSDSIYDSLLQIMAHTNSSTTTNLRWYSTSNHLILTSPDKVEVLEYDDNNKLTIFQTQIAENLAIPSSDGHKLIILTTLNQDNTEPNFFSLDLK